jgi:cytoskeletal protein RodZ
MVARRTKRENTAMALLLLEALGALLILIFIVWWTMFSGRKNGELKPDAKPSAEAAVPAKTDESL